MRLEELRQYKPQILAIAAEHGVGNVRVFGSVARGEAGEGSDVDFLVSVADGVGMRFFGFGEALQKMLGVSVDVVSDRARFLPHQQKILKEAIPLFPDEKAN